jgi:hypothetical protein
LKFDKKSVPDTVQAKNSAYSDSVTATPGDADDVETATISYSVVKSTNCYYLYDTSGNQVVSAGWYRDDIHDYYVNSKGYMLYMTTIEDVNAMKIHFYVYSTASKGLVTYSSHFLSYYGNLIYVGSDSYLYSIYYRSTRQYVYVTDNGLVPANKELIRLNDGKTYFFDANGIKVTTDGWYSYQSGKQVYVGEGDYIVSLLMKKDNSWKYYDYDYTSNKWVLNESGWYSTVGRDLYVDKEQKVSLMCNWLLSEKNIIYVYRYNEDSEKFELIKSEWIDYDGDDMYVNAKGQCMYLYMKDEKLCMIQNSDSSDYILAVSKVLRLKDGKFYYFDADGQIVTTCGWQKVSSSREYFVNSDGYVTRWLQGSGGVWRFYIMDYEANKWILQKNVWTSAHGNLYYFCSTGISTRIYYYSSKHCYDYTGGKWVMATGTIKTIVKNIYYFDGKGNWITKAGWYKLASGKQVYVSSTGYVTKQK